MKSFQQLAAIAYAGYCRLHMALSLDKKPLPDWEKLPAAAQRIERLFKSHD